MAAIMRPIMGTAIIVSFLAAVTIAQKLCTIDGDCMGTQYCYDASKTCVNYTLCIRYNREEAANPSRDAYQCGRCLQGYSAEENPETGEEGASCKKNPNLVQPTNKIPIGTWIGILFGVLLFVGAFLYVLHVVLRCKIPWNNGPVAEQPEKNSSLPMIEMGKCASAPPEEYLNRNLNNNKYEEVEETNPLSTTREYYGNSRVDTSRPVKAQGYHPPYYVQQDSTYNPGDTQTSVTTFPPPDVDEETIPSEWTPSQSTGGIPAQPFAAIAQSVEDNTTNTAIQRLACPSPSTSQGDDQNAQNNNSSGDTGGFGNNDRNGNAHGNSNSSQLFHMEVHITNVMNQGSNGS